MVDNPVPEPQTPHAESDAGQSNSNEVAKELMDIAEDRQARDRAWQEYRGYDEAYKRANAERVATGKIAVERYPQDSEKPTVTLIAQIRLDASTGEAISGHDYNPEAQSHTDTEAVFQAYRSQTPPEEQFVVYEGGTASFTDRDAAIRDRADSGLAMFLADQAGVERASGDPTPREELAALESQGVSREEAALFSTLRAMGTRLIREPNRSMDVGPDIYAQLAQMGLPGFREYSNEEKAQIGQQPELQVALLRDMAATGSKFALEKFNPILQELGMPLFELGDNGALSLPGAEGTQLIETTGPSGTGRLNEVARADIEYRDRHLFDVVADAVKAGKKPLVVFGGSHVVALRPALNSYFGRQAPKQVDQETT